MVNQFWTQALGEHQALTAPPLLNMDVMTTEQDFRYSLLIPNLWSCEMGAIQKPIQRRVKTVLRMAFSITKNSWLQASHRIQQGHCSNFSTREHKIAQTDLLGDMSIDKPLINTFIAPTNQYRPLTGRPVADQSVIHLAPQRRKQHHRHFCLTLGLNGRQAFLQRLGHHDHTRSTTKRSVIDPTVIALRMLPRITQMHIHQT